MIECTIDIKKKKTNKKKSFLDIVTSSKKNNCEKGIVVKNKNISSSSKDWLNRHVNDFYVKKSLIDGFCSRAAYKLLEINHKFNIFAKKNIKIIDLGCSPGSWTQILFALANINILKNKSNNLNLREFEIKSIQNRKCKIIGIDLLDLNQDILHNVKNDIKKINQDDFIVNKANLEFMFIKNDFLKDESKAKITNFLGYKNCDLILSDISPNKTGSKQTDHIRSIEIMHNVFEFSDTILKNNGSILIKIFQGELHQELIENIKNFFHKIHTIKPSCSRKNSSEFYILCQNYKK